MIVGGDPFQAEPWLQAELNRAALALPFSACAMLDAMGVPRGMIARLTGAGDIGLLRVREMGGRWEPDEAGVARLILAVRDAEGVLIDLAALSSADRDVWALRTGDGVILGEDVLRQAEDAAIYLAMLEGWGLGWADAPARDHDMEGRLRLRVRANPIALLAADGDGLCVLDWRPAAITALQRLGPTVVLLADSGSAAEALAGQLALAALPVVRSISGMGRLAA